MSSMNKRRNFLKKTATGAVIASLPAKSVWGACSVSGALSGNLSTNTDRHTCTIPDLSNGRSPGNWKNWNKNMHGTFMKLKEMRDSIQGKPSKDPAYQAAKKCFSDDVEVAMGKIMVLPSEMNPRVLTVGQALATNGDGDNNIYYHLAAVYLNAYFEFYSNYQGEVAAEQLINEIFLYWYVGTHHGGGVSISSSDLGYNDGTTWYQPTNC